MPRKLANDVAELLGRAEADTKNVSMQKVKAQPVVQRPSEPPARRIYNGDPQSNTPGYAIRPANKKVVPKKRRSTFNIVAALFCCAVAIILYIGNILAVNQLAVEVHQLQTQYDKIVNNNSVLKAEINRKSAWERIGNTATHQIGLVYAKERPTSFDVDESKLEKFKEK